MGPFKHTVDDGLDIRKAAFECMYTLLDSCLDRIDIFEFLRHVEDGLNDHYDIKMLTYLMAVRLAHLCPSAVLQRKGFLSWLLYIYRFLSAETCTILYVSFIVELLMTVTAVFFPCKRIFFLAVIKFKFL